MVDRMSTSVVGEGAASTIDLVGRDLRLYLRTKSVRPSSDSAPARSSVVVESRSPSAGCSIDRDLLDRARGGRGRGRTAAVGVSDVLECGEAAAPTT